MDKNEEEGYVPPVELEMGDNLSPPIPQAAKPGKYPKQSCKYKRVRKN